MEASGFCQSTSADLALGASFATVLILSGLVVITVVLNVLVEAFE